jgi:predicted TPR repeat methyltransferase
MASSGDLLADRRYAWAEAAFKEGDAVAAADLVRQVLEIVPGFAAGWFLLGQAEEQAEQREAAQAAFVEALRLDPEDRLGAGVRLAQLGAVEAGTAMSAAYVRQLFDDYAIRFDRHLVKSLHYRAPELLHDAVRRTCSKRLAPFRFTDALDLGCGTGLAGEAFRAECGRLAGIDLSPEIVRRAQAKRVYDELAVGEIAAWLGTREAASADLVLAADVFVYIADLGPVFAQAARVLRRSGLFAFTVQAHAGEGVALGEDARYVHGERYLRDLAADSGFAVALLEPASTRQDRGTDVPGLIAVLQKP